MSEGRFPITVAGDVNWTEGMQYQVVTDARTAAGVPKAVAEAMKGKK